jgi:hypothetical protein
MASDIPVYLEVGSKRTFAGAIDWPGWCRSGRDKDAALAALVAYGRRYRRALGRTAQGFEPPQDPSGLQIVARLKGDATTDFGAPSASPPADRQRLDGSEAERLIALLRACWRAFDRAADRAIDARLRKGPRGGGRERDAMVEHVLGADRAYLSRVGGRAETSDGDDVAAQMTAVRKGFVHAVTVRARGEPAPRPRRSGALWTPRYSIRRSAWHALDHAWEIEDRMEG